VKKNKIKILVVDDEPDIIEILQFNLENEGYKVFSAVNGKDALKLADQHIPHLIILDLMMPIMDGIEACERLRMDKKFNNSLIMFLSARGEDYSQVAAFESGADDYVTKPIKPRILNSKVKALLRRFKNDSSQILSFENIVIDSEKYTVEVDNKQHNLPRKEFELLFLLASKPGKVLKEKK